MKTNIEESPAVDLQKQYVIPLYRDLMNCKKYGIPNVFSSPDAVYVKKMAGTVRHTWTNSLELDKEVIQNACVDFANFNFLVNFQCKKGTTFNDAEMGYFEEVQQISELKAICIPEKNPNQTLEEFKTQVEGLEKRNGRKEIIPVLEPSTNDWLNKIAFMKKNKMKACAVIFRGMNNEKDKSNLSRVLANLKIAGIKALVFGVFPSKRKPSGATMLYPALHFGANGVSTWIAWSGRESPMTLLCSDWIYRKIKQADAGLTDYGQIKRKELLKDDSTPVFNVALSQIDTINQATLLKELKPLTEVEFKELFV